MHVKNAKIIVSLKKLCQDLKLSNEHELADKVACALSALAGTKNVRPELSYSYIMREIRDDKDKTRKFQQSFKDSFESALDNGEERPEEVALMAAVHDAKVNLNDL